MSPFQPEFHFREHTEIAGGHTLVLHALEKCLILAILTAGIHCNTAYTGSINNISIDVINSGFLPGGILQYR